MLLDLTLIIVKILRNLCVHMKERRPEIKIIEISRQPFLKIEMKRKMNKLMISFCRI